MLHLSYAEQRPLPSRVQSPYRALTRAHGWRGSTVMKTSDRDLSRTLRRAGEESSYVLVNKSRSNRNHVGRYRRAAVPPGSRVGFYEAPYHSTFVRILCSTHISIDRATFCPPDISTYVYRHSSAFPCLSMPMYLEHRCSSSICISRYKVSRHTKATCLRARTQFTHLRARMTVNSYLAEHS